MLLRTVYCQYSQLCIQLLHYICTKANLLKILVVSRAPVSNMKRLSTGHFDLLLFFSLIQVKYGILRNLWHRVCGVLVRVHVFSALQLCSICAEHVWQVSWSAWLALCFLNFFPSEPFALELRLGSDANLRDSKLKCKNKKCCRQCLHFLENDC